MITRDAVREALKDVVDPELGCNIVELGLIYDITVAENGDVGVRMTLTSPGCPLRDVIERDVRDRLRLLDGVGEVTVTMTFSPPWSPANASDDLKREFALMGIPAGDAPPHP